MFEEVQDPVEDETQLLDEEEDKDPVQETEKEKKKRKKAEAKAKKDAERKAKEEAERLANEAATKKKGKRKGKTKLPAYFTEKDLSEPSFQRQEAQNWLLGLDNDKFISRSARITYIGPRKRYVTRQKILIGKRTPHAKNNNWKLFHIGKPLFRNQECKLPVKDPDFIRLALSQKSLFQVKFVKEKPLESKEAQKLYQPPKTSQLNFSYKIKLSRLRSGIKTAVTPEEAQRVMKEIGEKGALRKDMKLDHIKNYLQAIIEKAAQEKKEKN